jgi:hypothetical protein
VAAAAGLVVVVGLGGIAATQFGEGGPTNTLQQGDLVDALNMATAAGSTITDVGPTAEIAHPGVEEFYLYGTEIAQPPAGMQYALWLVSGSEVTLLGTFKPDENGNVLARIQIDPTEADRLLVTLEPADSTPVSPGSPAWSPAA